MKAACKYFGKCSGCTLQQFPYIKQTHDKNRSVQRAFAELLPKKLEISPTVPSPLPLGYRTSSKLCLHEDELGRRSIGLYERNSKKVVSIPECAVHDAAINKLVQRIFGFGKAVPAPFYNHSKKAFQTSRLKFITIRYCPQSQEFGVIVSHTGVAQELLMTWAKTLALSNVSLYGAELSKADEDLVLPHQAIHLGGKPHFDFIVEGRRFPMHPLAFVQANYSLVPAFIKAVTAELKGQVLLDLYGGFGTYSFAAKSHFEKICLVEANPFAIEAAKTQNEGIDLYAVPVEDFLKKLQRSEQRLQVTDIILNPPRSGVSPQVIQALTKGGFPKLKTVTYVSCNPITLKRDLKGLLAGGSYRITQMIPFDMFPQTEHLEIVARLEFQARSHIKQT